MKVIEPPQPEGFGLIDASRTEVHIYGNATDAVLQQTWAFMGQAGDTMTVRVSDRAAVAEQFA